MSRPWSEIVRKAADERIARMTSTEDLTDRIRELEDRLHERDLAVAALSQQLAERDAAWERACVEMHACRLSMLWNKTQSQTPNA